MERLIVVATAAGNWRLAADPMMPDQSTPRQLFRESAHERAAAKPGLLRGPVCRGIGGPTEFTDHGLAALGYLGRPKYGRMRSDLEAA
jgi:hypothetical protein